MESLAGGRRGFFIYVTVEFWRLESSSNELTMARPTPSDKHHCLINVAAPVYVAWRYSVQNVEAVLGQTWQALFSSAK